MKSFEKDIRKRIWLISLGSILAISAVTTAFIFRFNILNDSTGFEKDELFIFLGIFFGMITTAFFRIIRLKKILKNKGKLEELHIKETDERNRVIVLKTCRTCINIAVIVLAVAAIVTSMFNKTVFLTLSAVLILLLLLYLGLKAYFSKR